MKNLFDTLRNRLIVSCQASGDSPFNSPEGVLLLAKSAKQGGAAAIRTEGIEKTKTIMEEVGLPVIGLIKSKFADGSVRITGALKEVDALMGIGVDMIAVDGTLRLRENMTGPDFINRIKNVFDTLIMADISTLEEAISCAEAGADCVSTTLSGYTPYTLNKSYSGPDFELVERTARTADIPVFAEGRINSPADAARMLNLGAWGVVVGTAITRPDVITEWYAKALKEAVKSENHEDT